MSRNRNQKNSSSKGGGRRFENNRIYGNALPIVFHEPSSSRSLLGLLGLSLAKLEKPQCQGVFDHATRSVWIIDRSDSMLLWRRGFFGKGDLSRSEPSWLSRNKKKTGQHMTSEEVREKRRIERKQFKLDRAKAIANLAAEAEAVFEAEGRVVVPAVSGPSVPSGATWRSPAAVLVESAAEQGQVEATPIEDEEPPEDVEHLQLTLQEAFFLIWSLDCLTVLDPHTDEPMTLEQIWIQFQGANLGPLIPNFPAQPLQLDNPFIINYVVYHHYRSLGWVVKGGIKFCVDYLLYKRGPVFAHAEFALVVCPFYEDPADEAASELNIQNTTPFSWSWLSTINRVNTQVLKTLILVYVTIPARARVSTDILSSPACLAQYSVREVVVRRFIPARMRD
ncbi:hypothetical protein C8J56DRAFT_373085 [Mycena floridula]|nr:hypothetical protein C8J56DRAFT_373085 [Mycena floridula]